MVKMLYVDPEQLLIDSVRLGRMVYESGFRPRHAISIWRGGTPVGLGVDAFLRSRGVFINHSTIGTASYTGIGEQGEVTVRNLEHLAQVVCPEDGLLIIDDVYESGRTIATVVTLLRQMARANTPEDIRVATVHRRPSQVTFDGLPLYSLHEIEKDVWIDYPHELSDLVSDDDTVDTLIQRKNAAIWQALRQGPAAPTIVEPRPEGYLYLSAGELLLDAVRLGVQISQDPDWYPNYLIALWPGGVLAGLPVQEVFKYALKKRGDERPPPDHISINTWRTRDRTQNLVAGVHYLEQRINRDDNVLIIDTTFRAGRLVNAVVMHLKEVLRRNLDHRRIRVACVYYNPGDRSTWIVRPDIPRPDYYVKQVQQEVIYPASVHKLPDSRRDLQRLNPALARVLYE